MFIRILIKSLLPKPKYIVRLSSCRILFLLVPKPSCITNSVTSLSKVYDQTEILNVTEEGEQHLLRHQPVYRWSGSICFKPGQFYHPHERMTTKRESVNLWHCEQRVTIQSHLLLYTVFGNCLDTQLFNNISMRIDGQVLQEDYI